MNIKELKPIIMTEKEFDKSYAGNWMVVDKDGKYPNLPRETFILTECKNHKGELSDEPFVTVDNVDGDCLMEQFKTLEEAILYLEGGVNSD